MDNSRTLGSVLIVAGSALCSAVYKVSPRLADHAAHEPTD